MRWLTEIQQNVFVNKDDTVRVWLDPHKGWLVSRHGMVVTGFSAHARRAALYHGRKVSGITDSFDKPMQVRYITVEGLV